MGDVSKLDRLVSGEIVAGCQAYENLRYLCDEGEGRFGGSQGEIKVRDYMLEKLREYGLHNVHTEEYNYVGWRRGEARLSVGGQSYPCFSLPHSAGASVKAELVFLGAGGPRDFEAAGDLGGKIALITNQAPQGLGRMMHRSEKYGRAVEAGASAFVYMRQGYVLPETGTIRHNQTGQIPAISITGEVGMRLRRLMERGPVEVEVTTTDTSQEQVGWNIVGEIPGFVDPESVIVVGAHIDGHDIAQAAADNGGGSAVILEAARGLAAHQELVPKTLRFVWFTGEEIGLLGSSAYSKRHKEDNIVFMLNCDVAGGGGIPSLSTMGFHDVKAYLDQLSAARGLPLSVHPGIVPYSDMYPFHVLGIPNVSLSSTPPQGGWEFIHSSADTFDKMTLWGLMLDSLSVGRLITHLSYAPSFPKKSPEEVRADVAHLAEIFHFEGRLPLGESKGF